MRPAAYAKAYPLTTSSSHTSDMASSWWMTGRATFTTYRSNCAMNVAISTTGSIQRGRAAVGSAAGAGDVVIANLSMHVELLVMTIR